MNEKGEKKMKNENILKTDLNFPQTKNEKTIIKHVIGFQKMKKTK